MYNFPVLSQLQALWTTLRGNLEAFAPEMIDYLHGKKLSYNMQVLFEKQSVPLFLP